MGNKTTAYGRKLKRIDKQLKDVFAFIETLNDPTPWPGKDGERPVSFTPWPGKDGERPVSITPWPGKEEPPFEVETPDPRKKKFNKPPTRKKVWRQKNTFSR